MSVHPPLDSPVNIALWVAQLLAFVVVFALAYRHNKNQYRDSNGKAISLALTLAGVWPITVVAWLVTRRHLATPFSPHRAQ